MTQGVNSFCHVKRGICLHNDFMKTHESAIFQKPGCLRQENAVLSVQPQSPDNQRQAFCKVQSVHPKAMRHGAKGILWHRKTWLLATQYATSSIAVCRKKGRHPCPSCVRINTLHTATDPVRHYQRQLSAAKGAICDTIHGHSGSDILQQ